VGGKAGDGYLIMGIKDKQTYGEYYWAMQVEAAQQHSEDIEAEMSGMSTRIISALGIKEYLPEEFSRLFSELESPAGAFLGDIGGRFVSEVADGAVSQAASPFFESMGYLAYQKAPTKKLFSNPLHPYTQALIDSSFTFRNNQTKILLNNETPSLLDPPKGCLFSTRCPFAKKICFDARPDLKEIEKDHFVACHLVKTALTSLGSSKTTSSSL